MSQNKRPIVYVIKEEIKALGAAQIMLGLIQSALGCLWFFLYHLEDETHSVGPVLMSIIIIYMFASGSFFINSGSSSVVQGDASACQLVLGIVMNTISIFVAIIGIIIFAIEFPAFEALGEQYIWSNMAGMMLLQISIFCTISELVITVITVDLFRNTFHRPRLWDEGSLTNLDLPGPCVEDSVALPSSYLFELPAHQEENSITSNPNHQHCWYWFGYLHPS
ncbi:membrane-spanning 4-domains subfamily A member 12-like [Microtus pennsylvanicus]|uniref:membrane-spanning 4-domains subfamily A member 12-like n=1 Tax=Microtus pennsylvanicus TaxID=10058 RepID=UPI003F6C9110